MSQNIIRNVARTRGNAMVEFVILMPLYLLLLLGLIYLGNVALFQERSLEANRLATLIPGDQSETPRVRGVVSRALFDPVAGGLTLTETAEELPSPVDIERTLYPPPRPPGEARAASATGHTGIDLDSLRDDLETVIEGDPGTPPPPPPPPNPPPRTNWLLTALHDLMTDWVQRTSSGTRYEYKPSYLTLERLQLTPVEPAAQHQTVSRTGGGREVRDARGANSSAELIRRFGDGQAPVPGFPRFGDRPREVMTPN